MKHKDRYAVFGTPVAHSLSPVIHSLFAKQTQQNISYTAIDVVADRFDETLIQFFASGGKGGNITLPYKTKIAQIINQLTYQAQLAGVVNTVKKIDSQTILGDNTDGIGLLADLQANWGSIKNQQVLLLGAGGAAQGVIVPLLDAQPRLLVIANRNIARAAALILHFQNHYNAKRLIFCQYHHLIQKFDLIINATSASLHNQLPPISSKIVHQAYCYDMMYGARPTIFVQWARKCGAAKVCDGLGMLVRQAAESFYWWRGVYPNSAQALIKIKNDLLR